MDTQLIVAAKEDALEYVIYEGFHTDYPEWFTSLLVDEQIREEYGTGIHADEFGEHLCEGDVFLHNKRGDIHKIDYRTFDTQFTPMDDCWTIPTSEALECYIHRIDEDNSELPYWIIEAMQDGYIYQEFGTWWVMDTYEDGAIPMDPNWAIIRNGGAIKYVPLYTLEELFITGQN